MPQERDIKKLEGEIYIVELTLNDASGAVDSENYDVYGAAETTGQVRKSFDVTATDEPGKFHIAIPALSFSKYPYWDYQICARRRSTGHEWLILHGKVSLLYRIADVPAVKVGAPQATFDATIAADSLSVTVNEIAGVKGDRGYSTYDIACQQGFEGTEDEWLASLKAEYASEAVKAVAPYKTEAENAAVNADISATDAAQSAKDAKGSESRAQEQATAAEAHKDTACEYMNAAAKSAAAASQSEQDAAAHLAAIQSLSADVNTRKEAVEATAAEVADNAQEAAKQADNAAEAALTAATEANNAEAAKTAAQTAQAEAEAAQAEAEAQAQAAATSAGQLGNPFAECTTWDAVKAILPTISSLRALNLTLPKFGHTYVGKLYCPELDLFLTLPDNSHYRYALTDSVVRNVVVYVPNRKGNLWDFAKHHCVVNSAAIIAPFATDVQAMFRWDGIPSATQQGLCLSIYAPNATNCTSAFWGQSKAGKMTLYAPKCTRINLLCRPMMYNAYAENPSIAFTLGNVTHAEQAFSACKKIPDAQFPTSWQYLKYGKGMFELCEMGKGVSIAILDSLQTATTETGTNIWCITMGIHVDHQTDEEVIAAIQAAEEKGWTVTVQWNGTATAAAASTFARRQPVFARLGEPLDDGTRTLDWGHYVTNWEEQGYTEFASLEEAKEHFNITEE